jgi:hypothetical protein
MGRSASQSGQPIEQFFQFSLFGMLASGYLALAGSGYLDLPTIVLTGAGLLLRLLLIARVVRLEISTRWTAAATLAYIGFYPIDVLYVSREFIPATVHLICFLAVARSLTAETERDYFFVKVIAFLELLGATLLSSSINFFFFLLLFMVFGVGTFCSSEIRRASRTPRRRVFYSAHFRRRLATLAASITLGIVILTAGLFFLLPRTARAAFRSLVSERYHLPGFSTELTLGQIGEMKTRSTPLMHVRIDPPHERASVKWRGSSLTQFDGSRWYNPTGVLENIRVRQLGWTLLANEAQRGRAGARLYYQVRMGRIDSDALFFTGIPEAVQITQVPLILRKSGDSYSTGLSLNDGREYKAWSHRPESGPDIDFPIAELPEQQQIELTLLPPVGQRLIDLARRIGTGPTPLDRARAMERHLRTQYGYTTELLTERVNDPLDHFLFERRKGHCEYFASAMAVMLRAIHIPSRVATGFESGTYNSMTGWHVIRASDAHSWVEAWIPGRGWTTFDPTPPEDTKPHGLAALLSQLMLYADTAETLWQQWVIDYNLEQQIDLVSRVERRSRAWDSTWLSDTTAEFRERGQKLANSVMPYLPGAVAVSVTVALLAFLAPPLWRKLKMRRETARIARGQVLASDAAVLYGRMLDILRRWGVEKPPWLTPWEFARVVPESARSSIVDQITAAYHELRYGGNAEAGRRMIQLLQELESSK